ncbi:hypothetical protein C1H46_042671 [Malus baccata]|uniref:Uncharacterized protein n=1 Tax=Malus baccata TaxID=106549 RepID=A0A540KC49_MALBA|nr:hypothetical protein C1H46_042671 [Malus baccata]
MEGLAMLRQLIGQLQELVGSHPPPPHYHHNLQLQFQPPPLLRHHHSQQPPQDHHHHLRWCPINVDEGSADDYYSLMMAAGKSRSFKMLEPCKPPPTKRSRKEQTRGKSSGTTNTTEPGPLDNPCSSWRLSQAPPLSSLCSSRTSPPSCQPNALKSSAKNPQFKFKYTHKHNPIPHAATEAINSSNSIFIAESNRTITDLDQGIRFQKTQMISSTSTDRSNDRELPWLWV